jgi:cytochrome P450
MLLEARDENGEPMTDVELRDELVTLLVAGHETTATELCWILDYVLGDARVRAKLLREIDEAPRADAAALAKLEYADATVKEVLRLRPVIPAVGRRLKAPMRIAGNDLPAGSLVVPAGFLTHHMESVYPNAEAFQPERFLGKKPDPYAWLPFGGGVRRCLGMAFAMYEMKIVLATVLSRVRLRRAKPEPAKLRLRAFTYAPSGGVEVVVEGRIDPSIRARPAKTGNGVAAHVV